MVFLLWVACFPLWGAVWGTPDFIEKEMKWRDTPAWDEMEKAYQEGDEGAVISLRAKYPELAEVFSLPFVSVVGWAAGNGATNLLAELIRQGALAGESQERQHEPALGEAAAGGWARCVRMLLAAGADALALEGFRGSALDRSIQAWNQPTVAWTMNPKLASRAEREESVRLLMQAGVNLFGPRSSFDSNSVLVGFPVDAKPLVDLFLTNAVPSRQVSPVGDTLLHAAAFLGSTQSLATLVGRGGKVQTTNHLGWSPLHSVAATWATDGTPQPPYPWMREWFSWSPGFLLSSNDRVEVAAHLIRFGARHDVFSAAGLGDLTVLKGLIAERPRDVSVRDRRGRTALHWAALGNQPESIRFLLEAGSDPVAEDADGNSALHLALLRWPSQGFAALLAAKVPLDRPNKKGDTPLGLATYTAEAVYKLLEAGARPNPEGAEPPLLRAVDLAATSMQHSALMMPQALPRIIGSMLPDQARSQMESVARLLTAGASAVAAGREGSTPLEVACGKSVLNLIEMLVKAGASMESPDASGDPVWFHVLQNEPEAAYVKHPSWKYRMASQMPLPVRTGLEKANLHPAAPVVRREAVLPFLVRLGARMTATNALGQNALHAVARGPRGWRPEMIPELFSGANPFASSRANARSEQIRFLVKAGLALEARDREGNTPWLVAWRHARTEVTELFVREGAETRVTNRIGMNALHLVCQPQPGMKSTETNQPPRFVGPVVGHLVKQGVDPKARDAEGRTPLHYAVAPFHPLFVAVELVEAGADPLARDVRGRTPLDLAEEAGRADLVAFLKDPIHANPFAPDRFKAPPPPP